MNQFSAVSHRFSVHPSPFSPDKWEMGTGN
jgi:hypothetical protein